MDLYMELYFCTIRTVRYTKLQRMHLGNMCTPVKCTFPLLLIAVYIKLQFRPMVPNLVSTKYY